MLDVTSKVPMIVQLAEKYRRENSGMDNRVTNAIMTAWSDHQVDYSKLQLCTMQAASLLGGLHDPIAESALYDRQIGDTQFLTEMRQDFTEHNKRLQEAGPWTSNLTPFQHFTGPVPVPYGQLIPTEVFEGAQWRKIAQIANLPNFKMQTRLKLEDLGRYAPVPEGGEYNTTNRESYHLFYRAHKYGLMIGLTWEMIVNDDMDAFADNQRQLVWSGLDSINATIWGAIAANPLLWDANALFSLAHNNLMLVALSVAALGTARAMMKRHVTPGGKPITNISPRYVVGPPELEQTMDIILDSSGMPVAGFSSGVVNPEFRRLEKLVTAYLVDTDDWYLWAEPSTAPVLEVGFLFGRDTPEISRNEVWASEEIQYRGKYAMGMCFKGYRGALLSTLSQGTS